MAAAAEGAGATVGAMAGGGGAAAAEAEVVDLLRVRDDRYHGKPRAQSGFRYLLCRLHESQKRDIHATPERDVETKKE